MYVYIVYIYIYIYIYIYTCILRQTVGFDFFILNYCIAVLLNVFVRIHILQRNLAGAWSKLYQYFNLFHALALVFIIN